MSAVEDPIDLRIDHGSNAASVIDLACEPVPLDAAERADGTPAVLHDLTTTAERDLVVQAVWLRLALPRGELAHLGHPDFGSRLYRLIGRRLTDATLALAAAYVREALRREPLVAAIEALRVTGEPLRSELRIALRVRPHAGAAVDLDVRLALDGREAA